jgi:hypothetical protein
MLRDVARAEQKEKRARGKGANVCLTRFMRKEECLIVMMREDGEREAFM